MPETITRPSPIIVQAIQKEGHPRYRHLWMPLTILTDPAGKPLRTPTGAIRYQYGKIYGPRVETRKVDGVDTEVLIPGQKFEYVGDPAGLENDPHLVVLEDPDGLVEKAVKAKRAAIRAAMAERKRLEAAAKGEEDGVEPAPAPVATSAPTASPYCQAPWGDGICGKKSPCKKHAPVAAVEPEPATSAAPT